MKMNSKEKLCEQVNRLLRERHISKTELADGINMDKSNLGKMLNGQHPFDLNLLDAIAEFLHVDSEELIAQPKKKKKKRKNTIVLIIQTQKIITEKTIEKLLEII